MGKWYRGLNLSLWSGPCDKRGEGGVREETGGRERLEDGRERKRVGGKGGGMFIFLGSSKIHLQYENPVRRMRNQCRSLESENCSACKKKYCYRRYQGTVAEQAGARMESFFFLFC